jgi:hypothetical protein
MRLSVGVVAGDGVVAKLQLQNLPMGGQQVKCAVDRCEPNTGLPGFHADINLSRGGMVVRLTYHLEHRGALRRQPEQLGGVRHERFLQSWWDPKGRVP